MNGQTVNLDYCSIIIMLRQLVAQGVCSEAEAKKVAARIAASKGANIVFPL